MKKLIKFLNSLGKYGEIKWLGLGSGKWIVGLAGAMLLSSLVSWKQRQVFLEAGEGKKEAIKEVIKELASQGGYQLARKIYQTEEVSGLERWVYPQETIKKLIKEEKKRLKETPFLRTALENLTQLYASLGKKEEAVKYSRLSCWVKGGCN